jgi:hypothetical protein
VLVRLGLLLRLASGRWIKPEWQETARREAEQQAEANKHWRPILERWRSALAGRDRVRRADAEAGLAGVTDPRAVPMLWAVFIPRGAEGQKVAVRVLGQIDSPGSSRALTFLALRCPSAAVRGTAIQTLRRRDPRDFAPLLVGLIRDTIKYEVRPVNGPGSPGELLIKDKNLNIDRRYSPPAVPTIPVLPSDFVGTDASGLPVIYRALGLFQTGPALVPGNTIAAAQAMFGLNGPNQTAQFVSKLGLPPVVAGKLASTLQGSGVQFVNLGGPSYEPLRASATRVESVTIPVGQMMLQYEMAARAAQQQLAGDVGSIRAYNAGVQESNQRVTQILADTTGTDLGGDRTAWDKWLTDLFGYAYAASSTSSAETPTVVEQVPLAYQPQPVPLIVTDQVTQVTVQRSHSCFAGGTMVRTFDGLRPIESLRVGDQVLTQDPKTGELKYRAVVIAYHNPPNATFRVALDDGETIVATGIHRLWRAGQGWAMVRELKPGDVVRTLGGVATVRSVEAEKTQPVYNLKVSDGESYFVGRTGVLAHDNSTIEPVPEPFDAIGPPAAAAKSERPGRPRSMLGR